MSQYIYVTKNELFYMILISNVLIDLPMTVDTQTKSTSK